MADRAVKSNGKYFLYKSGNIFELWFGNKKNGVQVGYLAEKENFELGIYEAEEELRYLMAEEY